MTIVCATHFSESSADAVAVASQLARRTGQPLWLVSVVRGGSFRSGARELERAAWEALEQQAAALGADGLRVKAQVLRGRLERMLSRVCEELDAGLLVLGDTRHAAPSFLSTPADRLAALVKAPLLVVRSPRPFLAWSRGERPLKVLLALDHTWRAEVARGWLSRLSTYGELDVLAVHVWSEEDERLRHHVTVGDFRQLLEAETAAALVELPANVKTRVLLASAEKEVATALEQLAGAEASDVIALGTTGSKGLLARFRSVTHRLLLEGPASVALVPDREPVTGPLDRMTPTSPAMRSRLRSVRRP